MAPSSPKNRPTLSYSNIAAIFVAGCLVGRFLPNASPNLTALGSPRPADPNLGWKSIDVFIGEHRIEDNRTWFSQAQQDEIVVALLGNRSGYFVDLAANDAVDLSNTLALERRGWQGLCIEPNSIYWSNLTKRKCHIVGAVVGQARNEQVYFRFEAGDHGGIAGDGFDNGRRWQRSSQLVRTVRLLEVFERYQVPPVIDYLSLDVEGAEAFILKGFPLDRYRIKVLTAERLRGEIRTYLRENGYEFVAKVTRWGESLWVHTDYKAELNMDALDQFEFPVTTA